MTTNWKNSAAESYAQNYKHANEHHEFSFEINQEEKEALQLTNCVELDEWFEKNFGLIPSTYKFEQFWNGVEDVYTCDAYWD